MSAPAISTSPRVGLWIYINLDSRPEKDVLVRQELRKAGIPDSSILRLSAIAEKQGHLGCTRSHTRILRWAMQQAYEWVAVVEDDFRWRCAETAVADIEVLLQRNATENLFDVLLGDAFHYKPPLPIPEHSDVGLHYAQCASLTSMYIIRTSFIPTLLDVWARGECAMKWGGLASIHTVDQTWKPMQIRDQRMCCTEPLLGYQAAGWSDTDHQIQMGGCRQPV